MTIDCSNLEGDQPCERCGEPATWNCIDTLIALCDECDAKEDAYDYEIIEVTL